MLRIPPGATSFAARGFAAPAPEVRETLERHGASFARGFNAGMRERDPAALEHILEDVQAGERGFAYEGAAMALALLDLLVPWRANLFARHLSRAATSRHVYMTHVGAGWALARLHRRPWGRLALDPLLRWLAVDGYGFHEAFFDPVRTVRLGRVPRRSFGYAGRVFDQGVGRALWFVDAAEPARIAATIRGFAERRHADLWSGVGLAATYAGAGSVDGLDELPRLASRHALHLAQGSVFAAAARARAGNVGTETVAAVRALAGVDVETAATVAAVERSRARGGTPLDYERWRAGIRRALRASGSRP